MAYNVDPNLALALAEVESSKGKARFRYGKAGRYWLPFGIYSGCKVPRANTLGGNTEAGIRALSGHLRRHGNNLYKALKKYNVEPKGFDRYYHSIVRLQNKNARERIFQ